MLVVRAGAVAGLGRADTLSILGTWAALYLAAVALPAAGREGKRFGRRFRGNTSAVVGLVAVLALACLSSLAPVVAGTDPVAMDHPLADRYLAPGSDHPLGTDKFGRDVWARTVHGGRVSLGIGVLSVLISTLLGTLYGAVAGFVGGRREDAMMRIVDGLLSFPRLLFVLLLIALFSNSVALLIAAIAAVSWMGVARVVRGEVVRIKERDFVQAAVATGVGRARLVLAHVLPSTIGTVIVAATLNVGTVILLESSLSFLGLGVQPPTPSWGAMVHEGREALTSAWWVSAFPALAITLAVVAFNLIGDGLRDALDTRLQGPADETGRE